MIHRVAIACAVLWCAAPAAPAAWTPPLTLSAEGEVCEPRAAIDARGRVVAAWLRHDASGTRVQARWRSAGGRLGPVVDLSAPARRIEQLRVAVAASGRAIFSWWLQRAGKADLVRARARSASGRLGPVRTIGRAHEIPDVVRVALDPHGNAVMTWTQQHGHHRLTVQARRWPARGRLGPARRISQRGRTRAINPDVAVAANGDAVLVWGQYDARIPGHYSIHTRGWSHAGGLGAQQLVSSPGWLSFEPDVALDAAAHAVIVWSTVRPDDDDLILYGRRRTGAGRLGPRRDLHVGGDITGLAVAADGTAYFTGARPGDGDETVDARSWTPGDRITRARALSHLFDDVRTAAGARGGALLAWSRDVGGGASVVSRRLSASGVRGPLVDVSGPGRNALEPSLAMNPDGGAVIAWIAGARGRQRIELAAGP